MNNLTIKEFCTLLQGVPKKGGLVTVVIVAPKIIFKLTPILLDINVPYSRIILSYFECFCNEWFSFYGHFSIRGFRYFGQHNGILPK